MNAPELTALSPLDGRYARKCDGFRELFSEFGLIRLRTLTEVRWLQFLAGHPEIKECVRLPPAVNKTLDALVENFSTEQAQRIKDIEKTTNHDVKAVEYLIAEILADNDAPDIRPFVHFACTSEDINNIAYALMLSEGRAQIIGPALRQLTDKLRSMAAETAGQPMLARTHGQPASPTTLGKELGNIVARLERQMSVFEGIAARAKMNGAVGNFNAHMVAYPDLDWPELSRTFIESLGLEFNPYTTQIEPHDWIAEYCDALARINTILIDASRDFWSYISIGYFSQRRVASEVGSSTMPHKVNPIDFENAEGNLGVANALLRHLSEKLPVSRWQRDLSDSTALRNLGVAVGHGLLAWQSLLVGLGKLEPDPARMDADLAANREVLGEAIQTVMRRHGQGDAYEQLKGLTRGEKVTAEILQQFIEGLDLPDDVKRELLSLEPATYTGLAAELTAALLDRDKR